MKHSVRVYGFAFLFWAIWPCDKSLAEAPHIPEHLEVFPSFYVPKGETPPSPAEQELVKKHLKWAQDRFRVMLHQKSTFKIAARKPVIIDSSRTLSDYLALPEMGAPSVLGEVMDELHVNRFTTPYMHFIIIMNRKDEVPIGGGRPINGGYNEGGGVVVMSQYAFNSVGNVQSTVRHETGHAFGLLHVDALGYDMKTNDSIMSYNPAHHTDRFKESAHPGILIPENVESLALNDRAFDKLEFVPKQDVPKKYALHPRLCSMGPMKIEGQPDYQVKISSDSPNELGTDSKQIVQGEILPDKGPEITFNAQQMWHTSADASGWVQIALEFPREIALDSFVLHSQHSQKYHRAAEVKVQAFVKKEWTDLSIAEVDSSEFLVKCPRTSAVKWKLSVRPDKTGHVCFRGLQFFDGPQEWFRPVKITRQP